MNRAERRREVRAHASQGPRVAIVERGRAWVHAPTEAQRERQRALTFESHAPPTTAVLRAAFPAILEAVDSHVARGGDLSSSAVLVGNDPRLLHAMRNELPARTAIVVCVAPKDEPRFANWLASMALRIDGPPIVGATAVSIVVATAERVTSFVNVLIPAPLPGERAN